MEFVSSGVQKTTQEFKPKVARKRKKKEENTQETTVTAAQPEVAAETSVPVETKDSASKTNVVADIIQEEPKTKKATKIQLPAPNYKIPKIVEEGPTMIELINDPFEQGRLSKYEVNRREKLKKSKANNKLAAAPAETKVIAETSSTGGLKMVDGKMVVEDVVEEYQYGDVVEEDFEGRYITSASFATKRKLMPVKWNAAMTERFYDGLRYFGCNFYLISLMFPSLLPSHIQKKFKQEDKKNSDKITMAIRDQREAPPEIKERMQNGVVRKRELVGAQVIGAILGGSKVIKTEIKTDGPTEETRVNIAENSDLEDVEKVLEEADAIDTINNVVIGQLVDDVELPELAPVSTSQLGPGPNIKKRRKKAP